ncbi:hypothetical protein [Saccharopolyspora griseoalba]|uniref:Uncharacterized protein n=1 Tax=Saccharopolyspora griseoalba TaxID=1431848 RepID=A0ABW2LQR4_9PSEU
MAEGEQEELVRRGAGSRKRRDRSTDDELRRRVASDVFDRFLAEDGHTVQRGLD